MRVRQPGLTALLLLAAAAASAAETVELTFDGLPALLRERSQAVPADARLVEAAAARTGHLRRSLLPSVRADVGGERFKTRDEEAMTQPYGSVEARLNVFRGGRDRLEDAAAKGRLEAARADSGKAFQALLTDARESYWTLVAHRELQALLAEELARNARNLEMAQRRITAGLATAADRLEFEIHGGQLKEDLESVGHEALLIQFDLAGLLGLPVNTQFKTPESIKHEHDETLLTAAVESEALTDVRRLKALGLATHADRKKAGRWWTPSVDLYGQYQLHTFRERELPVRSSRDETAAGVRLSLDIFDGLRSRSEARALAGQAESYERRAAYTAGSVAAKVERAKEELRHVHELIHTSEERIGQGDRYLALTLDEYKRGVKNSLDLLATSQKQLSFRRQYLERRHEYQLARARLLFLLER